MHIKRDTRIPVPSATPILVMGAAADAPVPLNFVEAKALCAALEAEFARTSAVLRSSPKGRLNLTPNSVKASPEYQASRAAHDAVLQRLRRFNTVFTKRFAAEIRTERASKRVSA